jgi:hypothetical protein
MCLNNIMIVIMIDKLKFTLMSHCFDYLATIDCTYVNYPKVMYLSYNQFDMYMY